MGDASNYKKLLLLLQQPESSIARHVAHIVNKCRIEINPDYSRRRAALFSINETGKAKYEHVRQRKCWAAYCWNENYHGHPKTTLRYLVDLEETTNDKIHKLLPVYEFFAKKLKEIICVSKICRLKRLSQPLNIYIPLLVKMRKIFAQKTGTKTFNPWKTTLKKFESIL